MSDFKERLSELLSYSGKDCEREAEAISQSFNSFRELAEIDMSRLSLLCGERSAIMIRILAGVASRRVTDRFKLGKTHTEEEIVEYLKGFYYDIVNETVLILPVDEKGRVISAEIINEGTVNVSGILPRKILEIMQKKNVRCAIIAHNHPSGRAEPSLEDIETTKAISELFLSCAKQLIAHYLVAQNEVYKILP